MLHVCEKESDKKNNKNENDKKKNKERNYTTDTCLIRYRIFAAK